MKYTHKEDNPYDIFSMKACKPDSNKILGHLPMKLSRITKFIVDRGAKCTLKICGTKYRRTLLVQGGLEVLCKVIITMIRGFVNHLLPTAYESFPKEL